LIGRVLIARWLLVTHALLLSLPHIDWEHPLRITSPLASPLNVVGSVTVLACAEYSDAALHMQRKSGRTVPSVADKDVCIREGTSPPPLSITMERGASQEAL
jgi:hypothetical protein